MDYGLYVSAAGALASSYRQDVVANNLANAETVAFKRDLALMQARRTESASVGQRRYTTAMLEGIGGGTFALPTHTDFSPSNIEITGSTMDVALTGRGFFQVRNKDGVQYTRDGRFALNEQNQVVTQSERLPVLDVSGSPIVLNPELLNRLSVDDKGQMSQGEEVVATLGVVDFADRKGLKKQGANSYLWQGQGAPEAIEPRIKHQALEGSGVEAVNELSEMIKAQRAFQNNVSLVQMHDQVMGMAVSRLGMVT